MADEAFKVWEQETGAQQMRDRHNCPNVGSSGPAEVNETSRRAITSLRVRGTPDMAGIVINRMDGGDIDEFVDIDGAGAFDPGALETLVGENDVSVLLEFGPLDLALARQRLLGLRVL
jgi:hypothetical protein